MARAGAAERAGEAGPQLVDRQLERERVGDRLRPSVDLERDQRPVRELLDEIQARPLYRAMHTSTDVAFVPYDDLDGVVPGARVMACVWGLFSCHDVGRVTEILPGEVVTEDPWGDLARGQFIVLDLDEPGAIREKVLRVRGE